MTATDVKEYALSLGYSNAGIIPADSFSGYIKEVESRGGDYDIFQFTCANPLWGAVPQRMMPGAKSILVLIWDYYQQEYPESLKELMGKIYLARCYNPPAGNVAHSRLLLMRQFLEEHGCTANAKTSVPARWAAAQAGLVTFGRNNFVYAEGCGSYVMINTIVIDRELDYDTPTMESKCPPNCKACMTACPTQAITAPFHLDPKRCIGFQNWMTQDGRGSISAHIPPEFRDAIGTKIHGCDICQDICPMNQKKQKAPKPADPYAAQIAPEVTLATILAMTDGYYERRIRPLLYNYIRDKRYFMRNAAIAMGNTGEEGYLDSLAAAMEQPDEMIREYAAWALGKIGGERAAAILKEQLEQAHSNPVKAELQAALKRLSSPSLASTVNQAPKGARL